MTNYYTWKLTNRESFETYIFAPDDFSTSNYYDSFTISVGLPIAMTGSNVTINAQPGQYDYEVHQTLTQYQLDLNNSIGLCEVGILIIEGTASLVEPISFTASDADTINVFNEL